MSQSSYVDSLYSIQLLLGSSSRNIFCSNFVEKYLKWMNAYLCFHNQPIESIVHNVHIQWPKDLSTHTCDFCVLDSHTAHQIGASQFQLQKILFGTSQKCRDGQQTLISCTLFQILHLQLAVLFQTKSPMSTFSVSGPKILSHIMPRSADDDTVSTSDYLNIEEACVYMSTIKHLFPINYKPFLNFLLGYKIGNVSDVLSGF